MKVLLVNGSPHERGCTYVALSEMIKIFDELGIDSELFHIGAKPISGCIACDGCAETGRCVINNDGVNRFLELAREADGFVFGTPVHYAAASGAITSFMDRVFYAGPSADFANKPAASVVTARRGGNTTAFDQLNKYFTIKSMPVVSSQYWNMVYGPSAEQARQDLEGLQTMRTLARNMAWLLRCIEAGRAAGIPEPASEEERQVTNFIR